MKLVRDCIPEIIEEDGKWCLTRTVHGVDEHIILLREKMIEETDEFIEFKKRNYKNLPRYFLI